ncbi:ABCG25, partial [Symbiodinium sp. CCMP2456]
EMTTHHRKLIYEDVLNVMQLSNIQNSIVGGLEQRGISGGQRKRVSIGLELAADPTMLFLDEPTSGLDAASSLSIVNSLKKLAQLGMTSVMVVHQPRWSLFSLFDDVLLLGKGGRTVYLGPAQGAQRYFQQLGFEAPESENPADWIMDIIAGEVPNHRIPQFIPEMLYELWEINAHVVQKSARAVAVQEKETLPKDEWHTMVKKLDEDWSMICYKNAPSAVDPKREGVLREVDLLRLLKSIRPSVAEDEEEEEAEDMAGAIRQLLSRIAGPSALVCTKTEVREFLRGLCGVVAEDKDTAASRMAEEIVKKKSSSMDVFGKMSSASSGTSHKTSLREDARAGKVPSADAAKVRHPVIVEEEEVRHITPRDSPKVRYEARHGAPVPATCCGSGAKDGSGVGREETDVCGQYVRIDGQDSEKVSESVLEQAFPSSLSALRLPPANAHRFGSNNVQASSGDDDDVRDDDAAAGVLEERRHYDEVASSKPSLSTVPSSACTLSLPAVGSLESMASPTKNQRPKEFRVLLPPGQPHGLTVTTEDGLTLKVREVGEGRVKDWNNSMPSLQIKKHDHIVQVNQVMIGADAMQDELQKDASLELMIRSRDHRKSAGVSSRASSTASDASPSTLLGRVGASSAKEATYNDPDAGSPLEAVIEVGHLESGATNETRQPLGARRNRSFASQYNNLRRIAAEQQPPGFCRQLRVLLKRSFIQWWRGSWQRAIFLGVITGSSAIMATMDAFVVKEAEWQALPVLNLHTTLALLIAVFSLNLFSTDRPVFWRERESGLSVAAFTASKMVVNSIDLVLQCFLLASVYYMIRQPVVSFLVFFPPFLLVTIAASGLGYAISTCFPPKHGPFITA